MKTLDLASQTTTGRHLIEASAGTGKTWTIASLYILLLLEQRMRPEEILVVTYTKSATAELRDRIRLRIADTLELLQSGRPPRDSLEKVVCSERIPDRETAGLLLTRALYSFDDAAIFTIHGFCQRALQEQAFESGSLFDTDLTADQSAILGEVCDDYWRRNILAEAPVFLAYLTARKCTPSTLAEPFEGHFQDPFLTVVPAVASPDLTGIHQDCLAAMQAAARLWSSSRPTIIDLLLRANLSQTSYKPEKLEAAAQALDQWLSHADPLAEATGLKLFTQDGIVAGQKKGSTLPEHPIFQVCQELTDLLAQFSLALETSYIYHQLRLRDWILRELADRKRRLNLRSYDDLLLDLQTALDAPGGESLAAALRTRYRAALIDEFQDTDPLQWRIFSRLSGDDPDSPYPLFLIGDPKQAIYSFRGADIQAYIAASRSVAVDRRATLDTNRRSSASLVSAVNTIFQSSSDPFLSGEIGFAPVSSGRDHQHCLQRHGQPVEFPLEVLVYPRSDQTRAARKPEAGQAIVRSMAAEMSRLLDGSWQIVDRCGQRAVQPGDMAVLVKAHYQADLVQEALSLLSIPSVQRGGSTIFRSSEALDLLRIMRAVHEPENERIVREALLTGTLAVPADLIAGWLTGSDDESDRDRWLSRFRLLRQSVTSSGIMAMVELLLDECGVRCTCLGRLNGERALTNLIQCAELLHAAENGQLNGLTPLITWLERKIAADSSDDSALLRLESDDDAVQIATIHASKGLEYPIVFLPFAWDAPSSRHLSACSHDSDGSLVLDLGSPQKDLRIAAARREQEAEAARLLYVALTRAEFLCWVAWGCINDAHNSPLFRLLHGGRIEPGQFKARSDEEILADISRLKGTEKGLTARMLPVDSPAVPYAPLHSDLPAPRCRVFSSAVSQEWRVSSFSSLIASSEQYSPPRDHDALAATDDLSVSDLGDGWSIHDFPRGSAAGSCLHRIFELLDFARPDQDRIVHICREILKTSGYREEWLPAVTTMIDNVLSAPLIDGSSFCLSELLAGSWNSELEFYLPLGRLSPQHLQSLFHGQLDPVRHPAFDVLLSSLNFRTSRGMLHGFMDMVFTHDGRYYIIDWKSNHLGHGFRMYNQTALAHSMADHFYILQHHIYTLALDRHLRQRLPGYQYETHFGGSIYLYLRGVSAGEPDFGIFRDRPTAEFIQRASSLILI